MRKESVSDCDHFGSVRQVLGASIRLQNVTLILSCIMQLSKLCLTAPCMGIGGEDSGLLGRLTSPKGVGLLVFVNQSVINYQKIIKIMPYN